MSGAESRVGDQADRARSRWSGVGLTDVGKVRAANEDACLLLNELGLWIVADGMGGHPGGDIASRLAVQAAADFVKRAGSNRAAAEMKDVLSQAIRHANEVVREEARARPGLTGMGTTIVALHVGTHLRPEATLVHLGDSRAYLLRGGSLNPLTRDHSFVEEQIRLGLLTPEEARHHPYRNMLNQAVGIEPQVEPDSLAFPLQPEDLLLLCTDGLTKMLEDTEILNTLARASGSPEQACRALVDEANRRGGADNTTVVIVSRRPPG